MHRTGSKAAAIVGGVSAACFGYGLIEARWFSIRRVTVPVLPAGAASLRVLHLSDIHLVARQQSKLEWLSRLAGLEPDFVVNTGDNMCYPTALPLLLSALGRLLDVPGVFVWGSNDYYAPVFRNPFRYLHAGRSQHHEEPSARDLPWRELGGAFETRGWTNLNHRRLTLDVEGLRLDVRGTDDAHLGRDRYAEVAGPPEAGVDLSIGVTHAPYVHLLDAMTLDGVQLLFAGHTHGGQVCVPGHGALITNCDLDTARVKGLSQHSAGGKTSFMHVSAGVGTSPFAPYRFACRPEVTLLTLVPAG